jgi:adenylosuccinate lyase
MMFALVDELARTAGEPHGGYVHWGATTQNIQQTGDVLLLRDAHDAICESIRRLLRTLGEVSIRTADIIMPGRTHWQHAVPITYGLKVAGWSDIFVRHLDRLEECRSRLLVCMMGGAAGTFGAMGAAGRSVQADVAASLGLSEMRVPARNIVDQFAELVSILAMIAATASSIAEEISRLMSAEFGEVSEPIPHGDVGSTTMPQKRNPKISGSIVSAAARVRALVPLSLEATIQAHEVDGAKSVMMDHALEESCIQTYDLLEKLARLIAGTELFPHRMRSNLSLSHGLINAEAVMMRLAERIGRQKAHRIVHRIAECASVGEGDFLRLLGEDEAVTGVFTRDEIAALLDPTTYTGESATIAREAGERAIARARSRRDGQTGRGKEH